MAPSPLICVPPKSTAPVDFGPSLAPLLRSLYSVQPAQYATQLATLNRARQDALRGSAGSDDTGRDLLLRWFGMLELLELRFTDVRVPFPWSVQPVPSRADDAGMTPLRRSPPHSRRSRTRRPLCCSSSPRRTRPSPRTRPVPRPSPSSARSSRRAARWASSPTSATTFYTRPLSTWAARSSASWAGSWRPRAPRSFSRL